MDDISAKPVRGRPFRPGNKANPRGRPLKDRTIEKLCKDMTDDAVATLRHIMLKGTKDGDRREAAKVILQYGWGRPRSEVEISGSIDIGQLHLQALKELNETARLSQQTDNGKLIDVTPTQGAAVDPFE